jgi:ankyrin repeat protein
VESSLSLARSARKVQSFDSKLNLLLPTQVEAVNSETILDVSCGSCHIIVSCKERPQSESVECLLQDWVRHSKYSELVTYLAGYNPDSGLLNRADRNGNTPLMIASQNGFVDIVELLLRHGADPNVANSKGNTCLHYCFAYGFNKISQMLIDYGADEYMVNSVGLTCYEGLTMNDLDDL